MAPKQKKDTGGEVKKERKPRKEIDREELPLYRGSPSLMSTSGVGTDTSIGNYDGEDVLKKITAADASQDMKCIWESGLYRAIGFPLAMEARELCLDYVTLYDPATRKIMLYDKLIVDLTTEGIAKTFGLEINEKMRDIDIDQYNEDFHTNEKECKGKILDNWYNPENKPKAVARVPKNLVRIYFKEEIYLMITMLSRLVGMRDGTKCEPWMFTVIEFIRVGEKEQGLIHWAKAISIAIWK